jgi:HPt (histidine-containing phosphotransfer) domain-containing protein
MTERLSEYFARESSDYLDQLETLLAEPDVPDPQEMLRLARGVRGSAQMGGADTIATVAERIEDAVRSVTSNGVRWTEEVRELAMQTVQDIKILMRALNRWGPAEEARVRVAIERWDDLAPESSAAVPSIATFFYHDAGPHVVSEPELPDDVLRIESLLLRGDAARTEALALRPALESALQASAGSSELEPLLDELFDLVRLSGESHDDDGGGAGAG